MIKDRTTPRGGSDRGNAETDRQRRAVAGVVLRVLTTAALAVDAVVHTRLAPGYQLAAPDGIGAGNLFLAEAAAAALAGLYVLIRGSRPAWVLAFLTAGGGLAALLLYRYVDIPAFGPFPAMYEPVWFFEKTLTAIAQTAAVLAAAAALTLLRRTRQDLPADTSTRAAGPAGPESRTQAGPAEPDPTALAPGQTSAHDDR